MDAQKIEDALRRIAPRATQSDWKPLINRTKRLVELEDEINDENHNVPPNTAKLDAEAKAHVQEIERLKDILQTDQEKHPDVTQEEFEAVQNIYNEVYEEFGNVD